MCILFPTVQVSSFHSLDCREEPVHVKEGRGHKPKNQQKSCSTNQSFQQNQAGQTGQLRTDEGSECTRYGSESGFGSEVKLETESDSRSDRVASHLRSDFSKEVPQLHKTVETEMTQPSNMEKLMEMMIQMRAEDRKDAQLREQRREEEEKRGRVREDERDREERQREIERSEREVRKERQDKDRELQREERQAELLVQLKEAQPVVLQQITVQKEELSRIKDKDNL